MLDKIVIGKVARPQGVKGEIKVLPLTDDPSRFLLLKEVYLNDIKYEIEDARVNGQEVFLKLKNLDDRNIVESLRSKDISIDRANAVDPGEDRYFIVDLIGCNVVCNGQSVGKLKDILQYGSADVYVIKEKGKKEVMVPALKKLVLSIDVENKIIVLDQKTFEEVAVYED